MNKTIAGAILMTATALAAHAAASDQAFGDEGPTLVPNAFGLVYEGAISENKPGAVNLRRVEYAVESIPVAANVYLPADYDPAGSRAAVVVAHPNGGSKDQVAGLYAQRLAEAGFVVLAFDARYQGESGGEPRRADKPAHRIGDIMGAVDFVQNFPGVAPERVGAFGICGGGGYTFAAAQVDKRIKAVATLSLFNTGDVRRNGYMRTQTATRAERQREAALARQREAAGAKPEVLGFADMTPDEARKLPVDLYREGFFYYGVTHKTPTAPGTYLKSSLMDMMAWDATDHADLIDQPLLVVAGDKADSLYMSEEAFAKATGTADKELFLVPGATHIKTYYVPEYTVAIAAKLCGFFSSRLAAPAAVPEKPALAPLAERKVFENPTRVPFAPEPVLVLGTWNEDGTPNAMTAAWGIQSSFARVHVFLSKHLTTENLARCRAFTLAYATPATMAAADYVGIVSGAAVPDKVARAELGAEKSPRVDAPLFAAFPVSLECEVERLELDGEGFELVGHVKGVVADPSVLTDGQVDFGLLRPILFDGPGGAYRAYGEKIGNAFREGAKFK